MSMLLHHPAMGDAKHVAVMWPFVKLLVF